MQKLPSLYELHHATTIVTQATTDARKCYIDAKDDYAAVIKWLDLYKDRPNTYKAYQKEAERFLLWLIIQQKKQLAALSLEDVTAYFVFLQDPKPRDTWCASSRGQNGKRGTAAWRPFIGPLSIAAQQTARTILNSLFVFLIKVKYLDFNPISVVKITNAKNFSPSERKISVLTKILQPNEWQAILDTLVNLPEDNQHAKDYKYRLRFIVAMLYLLGLRVSELVDTTWKQFVILDNNWWFLVKGKGGKEGMIPVNDALLSEIAKYREQQKLTSLPISKEERPIIPSWYNTKANIGANYIAKMLKSLALLTAEKFPDDPNLQAKLAKFSPHWLRHLSASMQSKSGISFLHIKDNLRHSKNDTTSIYMHSLDELRHADMQKLVFVENK